MPSGPGLDWCKSGCGLKLVTGCFVYLGPVSGQAFNEVLPSLQLHLLSGTGHMPRSGFAAPPAGHRQQHPYPVVAYKVPKFLALK